MKKQEAAWLGSAQIDGDRVSTEVPEGPWGEISMGQKFRYFRHRKKVSDPEGGMGVRKKEGKC